MTPQAGQLAAALEAVFGPDGVLAREVPRYRPREVQQQMAAAVAEAIADGRDLVVEAGTGTGKTFAYLVPALLSGRRIVVSTGTLNLQDQLFYRDLPRVLQALGTPARVSLLKGRANYVCRHRLGQAQLQPALRGDWDRLRALGAWVQQAEEGELAQSGLVRADEPLAARVTSTADNCLGGRCAEFERCFVVKARRAAQAADVVVVNHHLLLADLALREEGFARILPGADAVIVDEAHQLPETGARFFGSRISTRQLRELVTDAQGELRSIGDPGALAAELIALDQAVTATERRPPPAGARETVDGYRQRPGVEEVLAQLTAALEQVADALQKLSERSPGLAQCAERAAVQHAALAAALAAPDTEDGPVAVRWVEGSARGAVFCTTPVETAEAFRNLRAAHPGAWVFTSATLAVGDDFSHFRDQLGLDPETESLRLESPYEFARQARLFIPEGLPEPQDPAHTDAVVDVLLPLLRASGGGAFVLCTTHRALRQVAQRLQREQPLRVYVQGEAGRAELLDAFARDGHGVLVGAQSFWEGVDVRGPALRLVLIDKLPFAAPGDPVFDARLRALRAAGRDPFRDHQLPQAIMSLRQGMGRLIRDLEDRGLLVLCDGRVRSRGYGRRVLASLPDMPLLTRSEEAEAWLRTICASAPAQETA